MNYVCSMSHVYMHPLNLIYISLPCTYSLFLIPHPYLSLFLLWRAGGKVVTGAALAEMLQQYCNALTQGQGRIRDVAQLPTQRQMLARLGVQRGLRAGLQCYRQQAQQLIATGRLPMGDDKLM